MKSGVARRVLFLVDRRALAAQAVRAFASFEAEPGLKFDKIYEVYSPALPAGGLRTRTRSWTPRSCRTRYLTDPKPATPSSTSAPSSGWPSTCSAGRQLSRSATRTIDDDAEQLDIPIHAFDLIIADECHRGYIGQGDVGLARHARPLRRHQDRPDRHAGRAHHGLLRERRLPLRVRAGRPRGPPGRLRRRHGSSPTSA